MAAVVYPSTLPAPSLWGGQPFDRAARSPLPGNTQLRGRSRDAMQDIDVAWVYTASEMAAWVAWYDATLLYGTRWFAMAGPGAGGWIVRVLKFRTNSLRRELLGNGHFRVSAKVQQRGISASPDAQPRYRWYSAVHGVGSGLFASVEGAAQVDAAAVVVTNPTFLGFDRIDNLSYGTNGPGLYSALFRIWYLSGATSLAEAYRIAI